MSAQQNLKDPSVPVRRIRLETDDRLTAWMIVPPDEGYAPGNEIEGRYVEVTDGPETIRVVTFARRVDSQRALRHIRSDRHCNCGTSLRYNGKWLITDGDLLRCGKCMVGKSRRLRMLKWPEEGPEKNQQVPEALRGRYGSHDTDGFGFLLRADTWASPLQDGPAAYASDRLMLFADGRLSVALRPLYGRDWIEVFPATNDVQRVWRLVTPEAVAPAPARNEVDALAALAAAWGTKMRKK